MAFIDIAAAAAAEPRGMYAITDLGTASRLAVEQGHRLRWCQSLDNWVIYSGGRWQTETLKGSQRMITETCLSQRIDHPEAQVDLTSAGYVKRVIFHAQALLAIELSEFDRITGILNFRNGTLDLRTGELMHHQPGHYITQQIPYDWSPRASYSAWRSHLNVMCKGNKDLQDTLQLLVGATLWGGSDRDQVFVHLRGKGRNGKGVFLRVLGKALGDYYVSAPINLFSLGENAHSAEYMTLRGSRMVACSEMGTNKLNIGILKMLTGGDEVTARAMRRDPVTFANTWLVWFATNYSLNTTGDFADALWERYVPLNLGDMIPEAERDNLIEEKLQSEVLSSGIIRWAVDGCLMWRDMNSKVPLSSQIREWRSQERESSDVFGTYIEEALEITNSPGDKIVLQDISLNYQTWATVNGEDLKMTSKNISSDLRTRFGLVVKAGAANKRTVYGIRWNRSSPMFC